MDRKMDMDRHRNGDWLNGRSLYELESHRDCGRISATNLDSARSSTQQLQSNIAGRNGFAKKIGRLDYGREEPVGSGKMQPKVDESRGKLNGGINVLERYRSLSRDREEEQERLTTQTKEDERGGHWFSGGEFEMNGMLDIVSQYKTAMLALKYNSKPVINNLSILAGENLSSAKGIALAICEHILEVPRDEKLPFLYLLDSIAKNVGNEYIKYFAAHLPEVYCKSYRQVEPSTHSSMQHLFHTWNSVFPTSTLRKIEQELQFTSSSNGPLPTRFQDGFIKSTSQLTGHGIQVNSMHFESQPHSPQLKGRVDGASGKNLSDMERSMTHETENSGGTHTINRSLILHSPERDNANDGLDSRQYLAFEQSTQKARPQSLWTEENIVRSLEKDVGQSQISRANGFPVMNKQSFQDCSKGNGIHWKENISRGSSDGTSRLIAISLLKRNEDVNRSIVSERDWMNSEEEEYVWEELTPTLGEDKLDGDGQKTNNWSLDKTNGNFCPSELEKEQDHIPSPGREQGLLSFEKRSPLCQALGKDALCSNPKLHKSDVYVQPSEIGVLASLDHTRQGSLALRQPPSTPQHSEHYPQAKHFPQARLPGNNDTLSIYNHNDVLSYSEFHTGAPIMQRNSFAEPTLGNISYLNSAPALAPASPTIGNLPSVTTASREVSQSLQPVTPPIQPIKFSAQHVPQLPSFPPADNLPFDIQPNQASTLNSFCNQIQPVPFQDPQKIHLYSTRVRQSFPSVQEVVVPVQTANQLQEHQMKKGWQQPQPSFSLHESQCGQASDPPEQRTDVRISLQEAQSELNLQLVQSLTQLSQGQILNYLQSQHIEITENVDTEILQNRPNSGPMVASQVQPNTENMLTAFRTSVPMPSTQNSGLISSPIRPLTSTLVGPFQPNVVLPLVQAQQPLVADPPPFYFSGTTVNSSFHSAKSVLPSMANLGPFSCLPNAFLQPPVPPGPPPASTMAATQAARSGLGSVNPVSSLLSSLLAQCLIVAPGTTSMSMPVPVSSSGCDPQTFSSTLRPSEFPLKSCEALEVPSLSTSTSTVLATSVSTLPESLLIRSDSDQKQISQQKIISTEFNLEMLRERCESVINSLYFDLCRQCTACGLRFNAQEDHSKHMDWHGRRRTHKIISRKWFSEGWLRDTGASIPEVAAPFFPEFETKVDEEEMLAVPLDEHQSLCALCQEPFEDFYDAETDEWMYKGAIYVNVSSGSNPEKLDECLRGPIVHAKCKSDSATTVDTNSLGILEEDQPERRKRARY